MTNVKEVTSETRDIYLVWRLEKTESLKVNKSCSVTKLCLTFCDPIDCSSLSLTISWSLLKFMSIKLVVPPNHLILCHPLPLLPSIFPIIRVFFNESDLSIRWQSIGASASVSVLLMNIWGWFPLELTGLSSLLPKGLSRVFSSTTFRRHQFFSALPFLWSSSHIHTWLVERV